MVRIPSPTRIAPALGATLAEAAGGLYTSDRWRAKVLAVTRRVVCGIGVLMEISGVGVAAVGGTRMRVSAVLVAFLMVAGSLLLIQGAAQAAPAGAPAAAVVALPSIDGAQAQIGNIGNLFQTIVCPILLSVRNSFSGGPFAGFITPILNQLLAAFGCSASG